MKIIRIVGRVGLDASKIFEDISDSADISSISNNIPWSVKYTF